MKSSMQKSFLIQARNFKEISEGKGYLEYRLVDENGDARVVTATARTGRFREVSQIKAVYKREEPLVKALMQASVDDTITIDFTKFNKKNSRSKLTESDQNSSYSGAYSNHSNSMPVFDSANVMRLFGIAVIGFTLLAMTKFFL